MAERVKFLSVFHGVGEPFDDFLACLRDEVRYCGFETLKILSNPEEELVKIKFISGLRNLKANLGLLDGIKAKPTLNLFEMTESLLFRSQAMAFASSSTADKQVMVKEELGYNFKKTYKKTSENFTGSKGKGHLCDRCGGEAHSSQPCPPSNKKCNNCEKAGHFAKMCKKNKAQPRSGKYDQHNTFCGEEGKLSAQTSSEMDVGMYYTRENVFNMSATEEYLTIRGQKTKRRFETGADSTVISSFFSTELG